MSGTVQVGAWYNFGQKSQRPAVSYHDGNLAVRLASPYPFPALRRGIIKRALAYERRVYADMRLIFPMSQWLAESFARDFGVPRERIAPVGAGINLPNIADTSGRDPTGTDILFVGKDFIRKGGATLLEAFKKVRKSVPNATLTIVGPSLVSLPDGVRCLGAIDKSSTSGIQTLLELYARSALFVLPSIYEPFGIVLAEAMAHGLPCVGSRVCAIPEIISHGTTGLLFSAGDSTDLAKQMLEILTDAGARQAMSAAGRQRQREMFSWDSVATRIRDRMTANGLLA